MANGLIPVGLERYYGPRGDLCLCLSGGGFRAASFHLGVVRWLHRNRILRYVEEFRAVSGGALLAAWLARHRDWLFDVDDLREFDQRVRDPFMEFLARDIRTMPILRTVGWNVMNKAPRVALLQRSVEDLLSTVTPPRDTDRRFRALAYDIVREELVELDCASARAADVVVASASFPPIFGPTRIDDRRLVDGGIASNLGVTASTCHEWLGVLVSDAGRASPRWTKGKFVPLTLRVMPVLRDGATRTIRSQIAAANSDANIVAVCALAHEEWYGNDSTRDVDERLAERVRRRAARLRTDLAGFHPSDISMLLDLGEDSARRIMTHTFEAWSARVDDDETAVTPRGSAFKQFLVEWEAETP